jgi:hypothetical protein
MDVRLDLERMRRVKKISYQLSWNQCPACGFLTTDMAVLKVGTPCPHCGATEVFRGFPGLYAIKYCEMVREAFDQEQNEIAVIFTCALLESLLEEFLVSLMKNRGVPAKVTEAMFEGFQGVYRRQRLFKLLTTNSLKKDIGDLDLNYKDFYKEWLDTDVGITRFRNKFLHAEIYSIARTHAEKAFHLALFSFEVFARLSNKYCVEDQSGSDPLWRE